MASAIGNYLPSLPAVARFGAAPVAVGLVSGLGGWWFSEQIIPFFNNNKWTVPVVSSLSGFAIMLILMLRT